MDYLQTNRNTIKVNFVAVWKLAFNTIVVHEVLHNSGETALMYQIT